MDLTPQHESCIEVSRILRFQILTFRINSSNILELPKIQPRHQAHTCMQTKPARQKGKTW